MFFLFISADHRCCRHFCGRHKTSHVVAAKAVATMALGRLEKSRTVNLAVEPSFTLLGLRSTAKIHDAENNHSVYFWGRKGVIPYISMYWGAKRDQSTFS